MTTPASAPLDDAALSLTRTARLSELQAIDSDIALLLATASTAISALTEPTPSADAFAQHTATYHQLLSSIAVRLRRAILQLQTAEIPVVVAGSGNAALDVGVLNARNDVVGRTMEAECWSEARRFMEGVVGVVAADGMDMDSQMSDPGPLTT